MAISQCSRPFMLCASQVMPFTSAPVSLNTYIKPPMINTNRMISILSTIPLTGACKILMKPCWFLFCLVKEPGTETGLRISPVINFSAFMCMPRLSNVCCVSGRATSLLSVTILKFLSATDSLLYCPAGKSQVLIAASIITIIKIGMGPGSDFLFAI